MHLQRRCLSLWTQSLLLASQSLSKGFSQPSLTSSLKNAQKLTEHAYGA